MGWSRLKERIDERWERVAVGGSVLSILLAGLFFLLYFILIPNIVKQMVTQQSIFVEGSEVLEQWREPKFKMQLKIWVFSIRNPDEVLKGEKPVVKETGPYVFDKKYKHEVLSSGNGTVRFKRKTLYFFNELDSCPTCILGNRVWIPNIIYQKFVEVASRPDMRAAATTLLAQTPFLELEVGDLLFKGYKDPFLENFCEVPFVNVVCQAVFSLPERIGLFFGLNDTYIDGEYVVKDGSNNIMERGDVITYNGINHLRESVWETEEARSVKGTEGTLFHPFITKHDKLFTFSNQLCRSVYLEYEKDVTLRDLSLYRFRMPPQIFDTNREDEAGFCRQNNKVIYSSQETVNNTKHCYPPGILPFQKCRPNEPPIVASFPNFYSSSAEVQERIIGLREGDPDTDLTYADIEPTLGIAVRAHRGMQLNIEFWAGKDIIVPTYHQSMKSALIPLVLVHDDAEIDDESYSTLYNQFILPQRLAYSSCYLLLLTSILLLLLSLGYSFYQYRKSSVPRIFSTFTTTESGSGSSVFDASSNTQISKATPSSSP